ncbi:MAG: 3-isopropylmalate dehydratase small subunit [Gemmatimonadales bacterium]|nr:3-isopropylmalate dehydratase small subunit [Gemmatimonadales bacterium]MYG49041.1 3-isopropylmalate dehydratase small subunit [Gemmatimonadales bacterium]MYK00892.1 3-isopropylmalate dehydratase small subunit [Candidatus Palauibacter ramosifaciens]
MQRFRTVATRAVTIAFDDIDTDQIIPARYLTTVDRAGLGGHLFHDWRYRGDGEPTPEFALNRAEAEGARLLIAGRNFGCGSSREHAVWALMDHGFDAVIAPSFADIFRKNALRNGLLPIRVEGEMYTACLEEAASRAIFTVDLKNNVVTTPARTIPFRIDPFARNCLLEGLDELSYILRHDDAISAFETSNPSGSSIIPPRPARGGH